MIINVTKYEAPIPFTVLQLQGKLDGSNFEFLIEEGQNVYAGGGRDLILDLSQLTFISSAGLAAIHQVALLFRGEQNPEQDQGWAAYHAIERDRGSGTQEHVKLLSPIEPVRMVLEQTGFDALFEIYGDLSQARASFLQVAPSGKIGIK